MKRHLFILHLWSEAMDSHRLEWRGRLTYVESGEVRFFRGRATLYQMLLQMLPDGQRDEAFSKGERDGPGGPVSVQNKEKTMAKVIRCRDVGFECDGVIRAETEDEAITLAGQHARDVHGVEEITPEVLAAVKAAVRAE
jgi:predicted small metal-binding protein